MQVTLAPEKSLSEPRLHTFFRFRWKVGLRALAVVVIFVLAIFLRLRAAELFPTDFDEDDYLRAGQLYAQHIAAGDIASIVNERENYEHPPLSKLIFGVLLYFGNDYNHPVIALKGNVNGAPAIADRAHSLRVFNATVGALTAGLVAVVDPLAGLLIAVNSWHIKYTSEAMLEALPCFFAALTLLLLRRSKRNGDAWWWIAAVALGITASGKYLYAVGAVAALIWMLWRNRRSWKLALAWVSVALLAFYIFDPALWLNPVERLLESLAFNTDYATGQQVQQSGYGWAQPLVWLLAAVPWPVPNHPEVFPLLLDGFFALFALFNLKRAWNNDRLLVLWIVVNMLFLFFWPTKWPQYIVALTVPVSLVAANWLQRRGEVAWQGISRWRKGDKRELRHWLEALPWLLPTLILALIIIGYPLFIQFALATTNFQTKNIAVGTNGLLSVFWNGFLGLKPTTFYNIPYYGAGVVYYILQQETFMQTLRTNVLWVVVTMALATGLGLWIASLLKQNGVKGRSGWFLLFILPWAIPEFVSAAIWSTLFDDVSGGINLLTNSHIDWLSDNKPIIDFSSMVKPFANNLNSWHLEPFGGILQFVAEALSTTKPFWVMVIVGVWVSFPL